MAARHAVISPIKWTKPSRHVVASILLVVHYGEKTMLTLRYPSPRPCRTQPSCAYLGHRPSRSRQRSAFGTPSFPFLHTSQHRIDFSERFVSLPDRRESPSHDICVTFYAKPYRKPYLTCDDRVYAYLSQASGSSETRRRPARPRSKRQGRVQWTGCQGARAKRASRAARGQKVRGASAPCRRRQRKALVHHAQGTAQASL